MHASSPGTDGDPQIVHAVVHDRHASCPSTRTGSTGRTPHIGHESKIDDRRPAPATTSDDNPLLRTEFAHINADERAIGADLLA